MTTTATAPDQQEEPQEVRKPRKAGKWSRSAWLRRAPLLPALVFTIVVTQIPFLLTVFYSFQSWNLVRPMLSTCHRFGLFR